MAEAGNAATVYEVVPASREFSYEAGRSRKTALQNAVALAAELAEPVRLYQMSGQPPTRRLLGLVSARGVFFELLDGDIADAV